MTEETKMLYTKLVVNTALINYIGLNQVSYKSVKQFIEEKKIIKAEENDSVNVASYMKDLSPLVKVNMETGNYYVEVYELKHLLEEVFSEFDNVLFQEQNSDCEEEEIEGIDDLKEDVKRLEENEATYIQQIEEMQERDDEKNKCIAELKKRIKELETQIKANDELKEDSIIDQCEGIENNQVITFPVVISNIKVKASDGTEIKTISDERNCFDESAMELSEENVKKVVAQNVLKFIKSLKKDESQKKKIEKILKEESSNEEKYIKYLLVNRDLPRGYVKTLDGAAALGLDANTVIELLEQPKGTLNPEILEAFVSRVHKSNAYNLKKELAEELLQGKWYVTGEIEGREEKMELIPYRTILKLRTQCK